MQPKTTAIMKDINTVMKNSARVSYENETSILTQVIEIPDLETKDKIDFLLSFAISSIKEVDTEANVYDIGYFITQLPSVDNADAIYKQLTITYPRILDGIDDYEVDRLKKLADAFIKLCREK
jgi:hypothetical protein